MSDTAVGYIRLSQDGKSLERQHRDVEEYADAEDFDLVEVYNEGKRSSGIDADRPEYQALLEHVAGNDVGKHHRHATDVTGIEFAGLEDHVERFQNEVLQINDRR